jgi:hypothetical protein
LVILHFSLSSIFTVIVLPGFCRVVLPDLITYALSLWSEEALPSRFHSSEQTHELFEPAGQMFDLTVLGPSRSMVAARAQRAGTLRQCWLGLHENYIRGLFNTIADMHRESPFPDDVYAALME